MAPITYAEYAEATESSSAIDEGTRMAEVIHHIAYWHLTAIFELGLRKVTELDRFNY